MIRSKYIRDVLDLLLDGDELAQRARCQIDFLTANGIEQYMSNSEKLVFNGVEIKSIELDIGAEAMVSMNDRLIDYLEIWSYSGYYSKKELSSYRLTQTWIGAPGREIKVE